MSLSTVIQGLLVSQLPEYEISNEAIGYLSDFSGKVLNKLVNESSAINTSSISYNEVKIAINKVFPQSWAPLIFREVSDQVVHQQLDDKESMLKNEISDFEFIDDGQHDLKAENKSVSSLFLSADFIKAYLPAPIASKIDTHGCMYLSVSLETVLSKLIQHARKVLEQHEDPFVITKEAIERAIYQDTSLTELSNAMSRYQTPAEPAEFEAVEEDVEKHPEPEIIFGLEDKNNEPIETKDQAEPAEELVQVPKLDPTPLLVEEELAPVSSHVAPSEEESVVISEEKEISTIVPEISIPDVSSTEQLETELLAATEPEKGENSEQVEDEVEDAVKDTVKDTVEDTVEDAVEEAGGEVAVSESHVKTLSVDAHPDFHVELDLSSAKFIKAKKPVTELYGKCCPYFDATTFAIHMLSSIMELFLLHLVTETCGIARPQRRAVKQHVREALARLISSQNFSQTEIPHSDSNVFNECVDTTVTIVSKQVDWDADAKTTISDAMIYISSRMLLVAAAQARITGNWVINSNDIATAASHFIPTAPVTKLVKKLRKSLEGEGPIISPPTAPRIRAAEMIYLTSLYKETPLQLDNQLLVVLMFLVSLSLHTLCCVK